MKYGNRNRSRANSKPLRRGANATWHVNAALNQETGTEGEGAPAAAPVNAVKATRTLTITGAIADGQTVTINGKVYTFQTVLTNVDGNVLIGASDAIALDNLKLAVTLGAGSGVNYAAATTAHPTVTATTNTDTTQVFEALVAGAAGNDLTCTETMTNGSFPGGTFTGGVDGTPGTEGQHLYYDGYDYRSGATAGVENQSWTRAQYSTF